MTLKVSIEKVTPLVATKLLEGNTNNYRKLNNATVDRYANLMQQGKWVTEACMIVLAEDGTLVNGQHRLTAVQKAQLAIDMIVVTGASISSKDVIDSHMPRRLCPPRIISGKRQPPVMTAYGVSLLGWIYIFHCRTFVLGEPNSFAFKRIENHSRQIMRNV